MQHLRGASVFGLGSLGIYIAAMVIPVALIMGYLLASPGDFGTWAIVGSVVLVLTAPLILANHHAVLFLTWNMTAIVFFVPGRPQVWLVMAGVSLMISILQRTLMPDMRFISVPSVLGPLLCLVGVILVTAKLTGGFGLRVFGSENIGGRRYFMLLASIAGFLAMIAHPIPPERALRYTGLFFLGSLMDVTSTIIPFLGPNFYFLFLFFPFESVGVQDIGFDPNIIRLWGSSVAAMGCLFYLLARHGIHETLSFKRPLRPLVFISLLALASAGGFRTWLILMLLTFALLFYFEGLFKSRYALFFGAFLVLCSVLLVPFANRLPLSIQRALSVLPLNLSPIARFDAQVSNEWRLDMWRALLPDVPRYLWLGKGLGISSSEIDLVSEMARRGRISSQELSIVAGDYHNGPLSVIIPFGIWGAIGFIWFVAAAIRALHLNYRYGDESLRKLNSFLLAYFIARFIVFMVVFGGFYGDLQVFLGIIGLSISLNHGICKSPSHSFALPPPQLDGAGLAGDAAPALATSR